MTCSVPDVAVLTADAFIPRVTTLGSRGRVSTSQARTANNDQMVATTATAMAINEDLRFLCFSKSVEQLHGDDTATASDTGVAKGQLFKSEAPG